MSLFLTQAFHRSCHQQCQMENQSLASNFTSVTNLSAGSWVACVWLLNLHLAKMTFDLRVTYSRNWCTQYQNCSSSAGPASVVGASFVVAKLERNGMLKTFPGPSLRSTEVAYLLYLCLVTERSNERQTCVLLKFRPCLCQRGRILVKCWV